jgi:hypothetical protein
VTSDTGRRSFSNELKERLPLMRDCYQLADWCCAG